MVLPSIHPSPSQRTVGRNLALDLVAAVGVGVTAALISSLLPTIARRGGLEPIGLAALAAAPFAANFLGAFAGRVGPRSPRQLALVRGAGAAALLLLGLVGTAPFLVAVSFAYWLSLSLSGPFHLRLWGSMYPAHLRGRVVGLVGSGRAGAAAIAALAGGVLADQLGGLTAVALAGLVGLVCAHAYAGLRAPADEPPTPFSARDSFRALRERPVLARMALAQGFYGAGLIAAVPLYAMVNVDRLDLSLADVGIIGILTAGATTLSFLVWGAVADRRGPLVAMRVGSLLGLGALVAYALAPHVGILWVAAVAAGTASASIEVGIASSVSDHTTLAERCAAMAGWNALTGARGVVAAFGMSALLQLGVVNVTTGLLLCAVITGTGALLFSRVAASTTAIGAEDPGVRARPGGTERTIAPTPTLVGRAVAELRGAAAR